MAPPLSFRVSRPTDSAAIVALVNGAYRGDARGTGWTHEAELVAGPRIDEAGLRALDRPGSVVLVAEHAGTVVGCVHLERKDGGACFLGMLSVRVAEQDAGIGRALLAHAETYARDVLACERMAMHVIPRRRELIDWYVRRGYARTGELHRFDPPPGVRVLQGPVDFERLEKPLV